MPDQEIPQSAAPSQEEHPTMQTYQGDLARAMDTTDASVVQALMKDAREREIREKEERIHQKQRGWYILASCILILFALGAIGYGIYYFRHLTVDVTKEYSVGIFPTSEPIALDTTDIRKTIEKVSEDTTFAINKPTLLSLVSDSTTRTPIDNHTFFTFIEANANEPFEHAIALARLGVMNTGDAVVPFIIMSVKDTDLAAKELLIAEPKMLQMFYKALNIDIASYNAEIGKSFESGYLYNLPVRTLSMSNENSNKGKVVLFYASVTPDIVLLTTKPEVLKYVYETVIRQH